MLAMAQRCLPSLRQQAGSLEGEPADNVGAISEKLSSTNNKTAQIRCKPLD